MIDDSGPEASSPWRSLLCASKAPFRLLFNHLVYKKGLPYGRDFPEDIFELLVMCVRHGVPDHNPSSEVPARSRFGRYGPLDAAGPIRIATGTRSRFFL